MLADDLKEQLKNAQPDLETVITYWDSSHSEEKFETLQQETEHPDFWKNPRQAILLKELQHLKGTRHTYHAIIKSKKELEELIELFHADEAELAKLKPEILHLINTLQDFKLKLLLDGPQDQSACFLSINSGAGGTESQDWANILLRMYIRFCERNGFNVQILDCQHAEEAGIKAADLFIKGENAYGLLKGEHGVHRLVRISPFDSSKRRHTSFASVTITPEIPELDVSIDLNDLRIDTYRAGGAGGQHVNKTDSAVRITHIPTNIVTQSQNERSQAQNKANAMKMLRAKIAQKMKDEQDAKVAAGIEKKKIEWGSQIRSYVLHPYKMVKDHRTDKEFSQPDLVLDGELLPFIEQYLLLLHKDKTQHI